MRRTVISSLKKVKQFKTLGILLTYSLLFLVAIFSYLIFKTPEAANKLLFEGDDFAKIEHEVEKIGAKAAYEELKKQFPGNDAVAHDYAHTIGYVAFSQNGEDGITICDSSFNYGCYHGFMIKFFNKNGVGAVNKMETACVNLGPVSSPSCIHGIGHGLMMEAGYSLNTALGNCNGLESNIRQYCWDGVFMERIAQSMIEPSQKLVVSEGTLDEPCTTVDVSYRRECWRNQVALWFDFYHQDGLRAGSRCVVVEKDFRDICYESVGLKVAQTYLDDESKMVDMCKFVDASAYSRCLMGVMRETLFEGKSVDLARRMCDMVQPQSRTECLGDYNRSLEEYKVRFGGGV